MDRKQAKQRVETLVQTFHSEKREKINEAETRLRFIDPFFEALGWDIRNPKEVRVESTLARSDSTRPDYRFLIDGKTKFFVEAKKPTVKLTDPAPVFQAKSYGFSSKVPLVILTDFEEFRPFKTLARPKFDRPLEGLIKEFDYTYDRYIDEFDVLIDTFSREAVAAGELEKRIPTAKKEASQTVDKEFLNDLSKWQEELAKNIALRNPKLTVGEINEAVQRILDRFIFLRICEDRQIEESEILLSYMDKDEIYTKLQKEFGRLRSKYNGLIFNEHRLSEQLSIDDKLLKEIIKNLYLPHSPYRFNEIPIEILGTIYEQYLGKVITLTPTHRAKVEVKPEVRKAGGVFYTPQFITSYIVKNTIGNLLTPSASPPYQGGDIPPQAERGGRTPEQITKLKFADIACGSGSFLLEMFDYIIHYHVDYYSANPSKIKTVDGVPDAYQTSDNLWHLSTRKKKEILTNNIYGVDIDPQAVEVTQMSLYLKLLEGESAETFGKQLSLELKETILPSLSDNIKCGNSLVGMDIMDMNKDLFGDPFDLSKVRPFDWETAFPDVMRNGGFDAIVGNPPYIRIQMMKEWTPIQVEYFKNRYSSASKGNYDIYVVCVERALSLLNKNGKLGYILPHKFFNAQYGEPLRRLLAEGQHVREIVHFGDQQVFEGASTYTCLLFLTKVPSKSFTFRKICNLADWRDKMSCDEGDIDAGKITSTSWSFGVGTNSRLMERLRKAGTSLGELTEIFVGLQTSADTVFLFKEWKEVSSKITKGFSKELNEWIDVESSLLKSVVRSGAIGRYWAMPEVKVLFPYEFVDGQAKLIPETKFANSYPKAWAYLERNKNLLSNREHRKFKATGWYQLYPKNINLWERPKLLVPYMITELSACLDDDNTYFVNVTTGGFGIVSIKKELSLKYLCGLLNSSALNFFLKQVSTNFRGGYFAANKQYIEQLPIRTIDFTNPDDRTMHDRMVQLVERMLDLNKKKQQAKSDSEKELFEHQIKATDREIDLLVYQLYDVVENEQRIIEGTDG